MSLKDNFFIRTNKDGYYSSDSNYQSLRQLYTRDGLLYPRNKMFFLANSVTSAFMPNSLQVLDYIDAQNQYILTEWYPDQTFGIELRWSSPNVSNSVAQIFGGGGSAYNDRAFECYPWDGLLQLNFGSSSINTLPVIANNIYTIRMMQRSVYVKNETNGAEYSATHSSVTFKAPLRLCLFNINRTSGNSLAQYGRIYSCKIYRNSRVISELVPCSRKGDGWKGFYDKYTGYFYGFNNTNINFCSAYYNVPTTSNTQFHNAEYYIYTGSEKDIRKDARVPILSNRLFKNGVSQDIMHPKLLASLDCLYDPNNIASVNGSGDGHWDKLLSGSGTARWTVNEYGSSDGRIPPAGILVCQGGGGGGGGADNNSDDTAGGGGGGGACTFIYYRIKKGNCNFYIQSGGGGSGGPSGLGTAGKGGNSKIQIADPYGNFIQINSDGGNGGNNQDTDYTVGGSGGSASASYVTGGTWNGTYYDGGSYNTVAYGTGGGGSTNGNSAGGGYQNYNNGTICDTDYLYAYCYYITGGGGGCGGDDTGGSGVSIGSAGGVTGCTIYFPRCGPTISGSYAATWSNKSGGAHGWENNDATPGGGGASLWSNGGAGGPNGNNGNGNYVGYSGSLGSGAGGSAVANNDDRGGAPGGSGFVWLWKY